MEIKTILVTGGAGFIGSNLIDHLLNLGHRVICLDNFDPFYDCSIKRKNLEVAVQSQNFVLFEADIRDTVALNNCFMENKIDTVIHLAALAGVRPSIANPKTYFDVNVTGTLNLLEAMKTNGIKKMLFASSSSVYGNNIKVPFSETDIVDFPISPYAASKKAGELICHTYHHLYGFDIYCLRFFTVYGPRQRPDLAIHKFTQALFNEGLIPFYGDGLTRRDYTHISDIINGIDNALSNLSGFDVFNLGESQTTTLIELIEYLEEFTEKKARLNKLALQAGDVAVTYANIDKARSILKYDPTVKIEEGLENFVKWFKNNQLKNT